MARKAVAATLTSVLLFTALLVADATVVSAQDNLASSAQVAQVESGELVLEQSLAGSVSLQVLAQVQGYLSTNPAECVSLSQYLGSISAASSISGDELGIDYVANATAAEAPPALQAQDDNLTLVAPFSGAVPDALNLGEVLAIREVGGGGTVSLERHEVHTLNLPISPVSASSLCGLALGSIASALSSSPCNFTAEQASFAGTLPGLVEEATAQGFALSAGWGPGTAACSAAYWITLVEPGVAGATGSFDWTVRGSGLIAGA